MNTVSKTLRFSLHEPYMTFYICNKKCKNVNVFSTCRFWARFRLFPSIKQMVAMCTWVRTLCRVRSSVPRAQRWMCWCLAKMENLWVMTWIMLWIIIKKKKIAQEMQMCKVVVRFNFSGVFLFLFFPDWDPCPWAIQNRMGWQKAGHYSHRDCRIKASSVYDTPPPLPMPTWLTDQPANHKQNWNANHVHTPHRPIKGMADHSFSQWDGCLLYVA